MISAKGGESVSRNPVNSSRILSVGWENDILEIEFHDGAVYQYYGVTEQECNDFIQCGVKPLALAMGI